MLPGHRPRGRVQPRRARARGHRGARRCRSRDGNGDPAGHRELRRGALPGAGRGRARARAPRPTTALYRAKRAGKNRTSALSRLTQASRRGRVPAGMGLLDDAIREHLELKRRHGADPAEVAAPGARGVRPGSPRARRRPTPTPSRPPPTSRRAGLADAPDGRARPDALADDEEPCYDDDRSASPPSRRAPARRAAASPSRRARRARQSIARRSRRSSRRRRAGRGGRGRGRSTPRPRPGEEEARGRARGDAGVPPGDAGARPALVRAEAAARLRLLSAARGASRLTWLDVFTATPLAGNGAGGRPRRRRRSTTRRCSRSRARRSCRETTFVQSRDRRRRRLPQPHLDDDRRAAVRRPSVARAPRSPWRARAASATARYVQQTPRGPAAGRRRRSRGRAARASMLQEPRVFGAGARTAGRCSRALGLGAGGRAPELPPQVVSTGVRQVIVPVREPAALDRAPRARAALGALLARAPAAVVVYASLTGTRPRARGGRAVFWRAAAGWPSRTRPPARPPGR